MESTAVYSERIIIHLNIEIKHNRILVFAYVLWGVRWYKRNSSSCPQRSSHRLGIFSMAYFFPIVVGINARLEFRENMERQKKTREQDI